MFSAMKNFVNRHRRKFLIGGFVVAGGMLTLRYAQRKLIEYQESKAREFFERTRRTQHFESTERTCNQAIMGLAPNLIEQILKNLDADHIVAELRNKPDEKIVLWNKLKVLAIGRLCALVYACSMLVITLRVQFNILGGYLYKDAINSDEQVTSELQHNYVALIQHFLSDGCDALCQLVEQKVEQIVNSYDLSRKLTLNETEQIFCSIQMAINSDASDPSTHLASYVYPSDVPASTSDALFEKMYNETIDMLESSDVSMLNANNVSRGFSIVMDNIADFYFKPVNGTIVTENGIKPNHITNTSTAAATTSAIESTDECATITEASTSEPLPNINTVSIPIPKLIPVINGLAKQRFNTTNQPPGLSTSLVTLYLISEKVKILGANTYEVFCQ
ncbi:peroxisomal biogenesis factor 3 [Sitodiplosis mosellana]|uniref:peroxisomal biogenesis factor 3 n=1 Tax=Sitodiplosis mosellana TaxID=263140 RepID=UPI002444D187|nr:peroxisomal biogenesis factor 3 [Sitodiplosis mosellana]